jgi:hypothetical protein
MQPGEFKQEIMRINNAVNQEMFGLGLRWQKVHVIDDKVLVLANNQRVKALATLSAKDRGATKAHRQRAARRVQEPYPFRRGKGSQDPRHRRS